MIPDGRSTLYAIWRACERFGIRPPQVQDCYEDCDVMTQAHLIAYSQLRDTEETKWQAALAGAKSF